MPGYGMKAPGSMKTPDPKREMLKNALKKRKGSMA
jgi:hypothetical protein